MSQMATTNNQFREQFNSFFSRLTLKQKSILFGSLAVGLAVVLVLFAWTSRPSYEVLFSNLSQKDAGKILEKLKENKTPFQLQNGGGTILVPSTKVYELRLNFAQEGLPESSSVGYEIFDKTNLGMTDFLQQLNYRRALEGELSRTIEQIEAIQGARVHIVIPKETLFKEDQNLPTASVILNLKGSATPSKGIVQGIAHLIASSVEGLDPENITILDSRGHILSDNQDADNLAALSTTQLEFNRKIEGYLAQKAQSMLDQVLGSGNAVVRVTADLNFDQVEKNIEQYDPDNTAVRSEEIQEEKTPLAADGNSNPGAKNPASTHNSTVTNYEVNKTVQRVVEGVGNIERLSVAVLVNNKKQVVNEKDGKKQTNYIPRTEEEMNLLTELVRTAVGFQAERNDQVSVVNVDFSTPDQNDTVFEEEEINFWDRWHNIIEKLFLLLAIIGSILIVRSLFAQVKKRNAEIQTQLRMLGSSGAELRLAPPPGSLANVANRDSAYQNELDENEVIMAENFFRNLKSSNPMSEKLNSYVKENPEEAARLIKVWLMQDEDR